MRYLHDTTNIKISSAYQLYCLLINNEKICYKRLVSRFHIWISGLTMRLVSINKYSCATYHACRYGHFRILQTCLAKRELQLTFWDNDCSVISDLACVRLLLSLGMFSYGNRLKFDFSGVMMHGNKKIIKYLAINYFLKSCHKTNIFHICKSLYKEKIVTIYQICTLALKLKHLKMYDWSVRHIDQKDIDIILAQTSFFPGRTDINRVTAMQYLAKHNGDIVNAIMDLY